MSNKLIVVYAGSATEAGYLQSVLEAEGIQAFLRDEMMGSIAAPYIAPAGVGAVKVVVAESDKEKAMEIVDDFVRPLDEDSEN